MKLKAKIKAKYLDEILKGKKTCEYRQIESIELTDETGRSKTFRVCFIRTMGWPSCEKIKEKYPTIPWTRDRIYRIGIGREVTE